MTSYDTVIHVSSDNKQDILDPGFEAIVDHPDNMLHHKDEEVCSSGNWFEWELNAYCLLPFSCIECAFYARNSSPSCNPPRRSPRNVGCNGISVGIVSVVGRYNRVRFTNVLVATSHRDIRVYTNKWVPFSLFVVNKFSSCLFDGGGGHSWIWVFGEAV